MIFPDQIVSIHTAGGVQAYQYTPETTTRLTWGRALRQVSKCSLTAPGSGEVLPDLIPWYHWVSVWDEWGENMYWTGPVQKVEADRSNVEITAGDIGSLLAGTRCPLAKQWDAVDPGDIANELWNAVLNQNGVPSKALKRYNPLGGHYGYTAEGEQQMMDVVMSDLEGLGLLWSVIGNVPVIGPASLKPVAALGENDFIGTPLKIVRDGTRMFNDVILRGGDTLARGQVDMGGVVRQTNIDINDMFGVSNVQKAVRLYLGYTAKLRDLIALPNGAVLHPHAPVTPDQLIPTARFVIEAYGIRSLMHLTSMTVTSESGKREVGVGMEAVDDKLPELVKIVGNQS